MELVLRSVFPAPPDQSMIADFRRHVRETGQPETWEFISTERVPEDGQVLMLAQGININSKLRPGGSYAPCPMCLPGKPKWLSEGALIWCESTQAVYCIGPDCSRGEMAKKLRIARNQLSQTERAEREIQQLVHAIQQASLRMDWIRAHRALAQDADDRHSAFAKALPKFRSLLGRQLKQGLPPAIAGGREVDALLRGRPFLAGGWKLSKSLTEAAVVQEQLISSTSADVKSWVRHLSPTARGSMLNAANHARKSLELTYERLVATSAFLSSDAFSVLGKLSRHPDSLAEFKAPQTAAGASIIHREEFWRGSLGIRPPGPLPISDFAAAA